MLEVFRELRRALVELVIDDREDSDADHRIGDWINAVGLVGHLRSRYSGRTLAT